MNELLIRVLRKGKGWTQEYVSEQVGIASNTVHDIETGKQKPSYVVLIKLENLFGKSHRELLEPAKSNQE